MPGDDFTLERTGSSYIPNEPSKGKLGRVRDSVVESISLTSEQKDQVKDTLAPAGKVAGFLLKNLAKAPFVPFFLSY